LSLIRQAPHLTALKIINNRKDLHFQAKLRLFASESRF
jgi:hypothetical protein